MKNLNIMLGNAFAISKSGPVRKVLSVLLVTFALACCSSVMGQVDPSRVNWDTFNLVSDVDYAVLPSLFGLDTTVNPTSLTLTPTAWSGSVGGTYQGTSLSLQYGGQYDSGTSGLSWSGSGSYGSASFTSSGSGVLSGTALTLSGGGSLGADSWTWQGILNYSLDSVSLTGSLSYALDGHATTWDYDCDSDPISGYQVVGRGDSYFDYYPIYDDPPAPPPATGGSGTIKATPEPSSLALMVVGGLSLLACGWRRRTAKA
jgi:hypothetical protein